MGAIDREPLASSASARPRAGTFHRCRRDIRVAHSVLAWVLSREEEGQSFLSHLHVGDKVLRDGNLSLADGSWSKSCPWGKHD